MKVLSVAIPCYNSQDYIDQCVCSLLPAGEDLEIILVDDGSTDRTPEIIDEYEKKYPSIIRAVHQENGGHGAAVNTGMRYATGLYFKVIDSDDWADHDALPQVMDALRRLTRDDRQVDMFLTNFIYDKVGARRKKIIHFRHAFPTNQIFGWDQMRHMKATQYILMHNIIYRHQLLLDNGIALPEHTFYVDNIFAFQPLPFVRKMYYLDVNFYHYYIGREDQSVNEQVMIGRIDQQIFINKRMIDIMAETNFRGKDKHLKKYMYIYLDKIMAVSSALCLVSNTPENLEKKAGLWKYLRHKNLFMYLHLRRTGLGMALNIPGSFGRKASVRGYKIARKIVGFN